MVTIRILNALEDVSVDFPNEGGLLIGKNVLDSLNGEEARGIRSWTTHHLGEAIYLLDHTTPVHLKGELKNVSIHGIRQGGLLNLRSILKQFLDDIIPENVLDELESIMGNNLVEDDLLLITSGGFQLLLNETRTVLIPAELDDVSKDIPQLPLASLVSAEVLQQRASKGSGIVPPPCAHSLREPMRTIQPIHSGNEDTNRGIVVQRITPGMRRRGRSHGGRVHHRLELPFLVSNASWERRAQHRRVTGVNDGLRRVIELRSRGARRSTVIIEHRGLWAMELWGIHCLWSNAWVQRL
jgi:hypothetical protein